MLLPGPWMSLSCLTALDSHHTQLPWGLGHPKPCYFLLLVTMELWRQLSQAGLVPPGLDPLPQA